VTWPILFPIHVNGGGRASQLDKLGIGNVRDPSLLYAHAVVAYVLFGFVMFVIARERIWLVGLRQAWYLSKENALRLSSRTVLYLDPPKGTSFDDEDDTPQSNFGEEARRQWAVTEDSRKLDGLVKGRDSAAAQLESAEVSFILKANKKRSKLASSGGDGSAILSEQTLEHLRPVRREYIVTGKATDKIGHLRETLQRSVKEVDENRDSYSTAHSQSRAAVFVEYANQSAAQRAYRQSRPKLPLQTRLIGVHPKDVLWDNLVLPQAVRVSRISAANIFIAALIIFWSIPSAFVGSITNVNYLANNFDWLHWLKHLPGPILSTYFRAGAR
jgi:hypothetical protein